MASATARASARLRRSICSWLFMAPSVAPRGIVIKREKRDEGDVVQSYQFSPPEAFLLMAIAIADVPTPNCRANSAIGIPISRLR